MIEVLLKDMTRMINYTQRVISFDYNAHKFCQQMHLLTADISAFTEFCNSYYLSSLYILDAADV